MAGLGIKVAYLDLDRADLDLKPLRVDVGLETAIADHRPGMLAAEIARQIAVGAGDSSGSWLRSIRGYRHAWMRGEPFAEQLAFMAENLGGGPLVVVLDTFEEAQYERDGGAVAAVGRLLEELRARYPPFRAVLGGRTPVPELEAEVLPLGDLEPEAALRLLRTTAGGSDEAELRRVAEYIGGNPLWLVLAGQALARDPQAAGALGQLRGKAAAEFFYRRILGHLHDVPHLELVEPSLHLRVLRPELLCDVVAPALGSSLTLDEAKEHLAALRREVALVTEVDARVRHREEVRALTLVGLRERAPERWRRIHLAAQAWWTAHSVGEADQAEAAYHALAVWDGTSPMEWSPTWNRYFGGALRETTLPPESRRFLREKGVGLAGETVPELERAMAAALRAVRRADWAKVDKALSGVELDAAGTLMLARARRELRRTDAIELVRRARELAVDDPVTAHEAVLTEARWLVEGNEVQWAVDVLTVALASRPAPIRMLRLLDARHELLPAPDDEAQAIAAIEVAGIPAVARDHALLRRLLAWVDDDELLLQGLQTLGLGTLSDDALQELGEALARWDAARGVSDMHNANSVVDSRRLFNWLMENFSSVWDLQTFLAELDPEILHFISLKSPLSEQTAQAIIALQQRGLAGDELRFALRHARPAQVHEIDEVWRISSLRSSPDEMARHIDKLRARDGELPPDVALALRRGLSGTQDASRRSGLEELTELLRGALPHMRQRYFAAEALGLPRVNLAARDSATLVAASDAAGGLDALVRYVAEREPAFRSRLYATWEAMEARGAVQMRLTEPEQAELRAALLAAFPSYDALARMYSDQFGDDLRKYVSQSSLEQQIVDLIDHARSHGFSRELILGARAERPGHPALMEFARVSGLGADRTLQRDVFERIVAGNDLFFDVTHWRASLEAHEYRVGWVEQGGQGVATAFLVGPDLVLTAYHVVQEIVGGAAAGWGVRFDYKVGSGGMLVDFAEDWLVDHSPYSPLDLESPAQRGGAEPGPEYLDFALIRLSRAVGEESRRANAPDARGHVQVSTEVRAPETIRGFAILQHLLARPLLLVLGVAVTPTLNATGTRWCYPTTSGAPGSSGSPVFDTDWNLIGLQHSRPSSESHEAIPIHLIAARPAVRAALGL